MVKLLASFQIGDRITDVRVFRWSISSDKQRIEYIDNRGERDVSTPPPAYDFDWIKTQREDTVNGRFSSYQHFRYSLCRNHRWRSDCQM